GLASELVAGNDEDLARPAHASAFCGRRLVVRREMRAFAEEEFLGLIEEHLVRLLGAAGEAVLVHDHLEVLQPHLPRVLRDAVVNALAQLVVPRLEIEARQFLPELCALDDPRHRSLPRGRPCITRSRRQRDRGGARRRSACPPSCQAAESATLFSCSSARTSTSSYSRSSTGRGRRGWIP